MISFNTPLFMKAMNDIRLQRKITTRALARKLGISASFLSNLFNNRREPGIQTAAKLAYWAAIRLDAFIEYTDV